MKTHVTTPLILLTAVLLGPLGALPAAEILPAFPEAVGFGANAKGGRGGAVLFVENLNDSGPGSLRAALEAKGPRTVVFRTGGTIELKSAISIGNPYLTVAGQTAPGGGIAIRLAKGTPDTALLITDAHDLVLRHLRIRSGPPTVAPGAKDAGNNCVMFWGEKSRDIIVDHCSMSWSIDQVVGAWRGSQNITVQHCIVSEGLNKGHPKGPHSRGPIVGGGSDNVTFYRNLMAHNDARNPYINTDSTKNVTEDIQIVNNVIYNWGYMGTHVEPSEPSGTIRANIMGNYFKPGPSSSNPEITVGGPGTAKVYVEGNIGPLRQDNTLDPWVNVGHLDWDTLNVRRHAPERYRVTAPNEMPKVPVVPAPDAYREVLDQAGANQPGRDAVDLRILADVKNGTGKIINHPSEVGGWPALAPGEAPADRDNDGMPDAWEKAHGLNPDDPEDRNGTREPGGYTHLEEYLNSID